MVKIVFGEYVVPPPQYDSLNDENRKFTFLSCKDCMNALLEIITLWDLLSANTMINLKAFQNTGSMFSTTNRNDDKSPKFLILFQIFSLIEQIPMPYLIRMSMIWTKAVIVPTTKMMRTLISRN